MRASPRGMDSTSALLRALHGLFAGLLFTIEDLHSRTWTSATFAGSRHELRFRLAGDGAQECADRLVGGEGALELRGHLLADLAVKPQADAGGAGCVLCLSALTVEMER